MDMCLGLILVDFSGLIPSSKQLDCPISPESTLQWLGLTDFGNPAIQDSMGILSLYVMNSNIWVPFCDTTKQVTNASDGFFITAVFESNQSVRGVRCKGSMYPGFIPRPTQSEIHLEAAFAEMDTEKAQLEANLFTWSSLNVENVERKYKENAMKLFSLACQNNLDLRAFELMTMLNNPVLVTLAMKYATNADKKRLAEKLLSLASTLRQSSAETPATNQNFVLDIHYLRMN
ncbi:WD repeat and HMG-box DNA-binding protein 1-like [Agrilus planipennis]|uniref:WD repeat and HMG-box DNA-binding protein 1-like n=1 Tax=Agrilus planipennis TaxID=224129 RepID=A0A7F5RIZ8_AGRPL|nr:WD repeat and HMG-box DNA-binding protein 1-like [Agrilus planipennis]